MITTDPLAQVGTQIKAAREAAGLSIEELSHQARVSQEHIKNIEAGNRNELPEETYLFGFLSKIFKALKISDSEKLLELYKTSEANYIVQNLIDSSLEEPVNEENSAEDGINYLKFRRLYLFVGIILIALIWLFFNSGFERKPSTISPPLEQKLVKPVEPAPKAVVKQTKVFIKGSGDKSLSFKVEKTVWFQVISVSTGTVLYEGDVYANSQPNQFLFRDSEGILLAAGNAAGIRVNKANGKSYVLGKKDQRVKLFFPESSKKVYKKMLKQRRKERRQKTVSTQNTESIGTVIAKPVESKFKSQELKPVISNSKPKNKFLEVLGADFI